MANTTIRYEHILRAIGQGLEALSVEAFGLEVANEIYLINGAASGNGSAKRSAFRKAFLDICQISTNAMLSDNLSRLGRAYRGYLLRVGF